MDTVGGKGREREDFRFEPHSPCSCSLLPFLPLLLSLLVFLASSSSCTSLFFSVRYFFLLRLPSLPPSPALYILLSPLFCSEPPSVASPPAVQRPALTSPHLPSAPSPRPLMQEVERPLPSPPPAECQGVPSRALPRSVYSYLCGGRDTRHAPPTSAEARYSGRGVMRCCPGPKTLICAVLRASRATSSRLRRAWRGAGGGKMASRVPLRWRSRGEPDDKEETTASSRAY